MINEKTSCKDHQNIPVTEQVRCTTSLEEDCTDFSRRVVKRTRI